MDEQEIERLRRKIIEKTGLDVSKEQMSDAVEDAMRRMNQDKDWAATRMGDVVDLLGPSEQLADPLEIARHLLRVMIVVGMLEVFVVFRAVDSGVLGKETNSHEAFFQALKAAQKCGNDLMREVELEADSKEATDDALREALDDVRKDRG